MFSLRTSYARSGAPSASHTHRLVSRTKRAAPRGAFSVSWRAYQGVRMLWKAVA